MTDAVCYRDAYARSIEAVVRAVDDGADGPLVVLDRTVFYPGGGGQPSDRGVLLRSADGRRWIVRAARKTGADIVHELEPLPAEAAMGDRTPAVGDRLAVDLDWTRRHALMFERMSGDLVAEIESKVNAELVVGRDVRVAVLPRDEAFAIPDLIRTKVNLLPPGIEQIRTIEIVGLDLQADGGTHVANTREVGGIRVTGYESKGRINKRIRIELADPA